MSGNFIVLPVNVLVTYKYDPIKPGSGWLDRNGSYVTKPLQSNKVKEGDTILVTFAKFQSLELECVKQYYKDKIKHIGTPSENGNYSPGYSANTLVVIDL